MPPKIPLTMRLEVCQILPGSSDTSLDFSNPESIAGLYSKLNPDEYTNDAIHQLGVAEIATEKLLGTKWADTNDASKQLMLDMSAALAKGATEEQLKQYYVNKMGQDYYIAGHVVQTLLDTYTEYHDGVSGIDDTEPDISGDSKRLQVKR
jgi:hypothetical protein